MAASAPRPSSRAPDPSRQLTGAAALSAACASAVKSHRELAHLGACLRRQSSRAVAAAAAGGSEGSAANAPRLIKATGVPVLEALEQCGTLVDAAAVALRAWGCRALQAGLLSCVLHVLERRRPVQVRCAAGQQCRTAWYPCIWLMILLCESIVYLASCLAGQSRQR